MVSPELRGVIVGVGTTLAVLVGTAGCLGRRLAEWLFPVRGRWLRAFLMGLPLFVIGGLYVCLRPKVEIALALTYCLCMPIAVITLGLRSR